MGYLWAIDVMKAKMTVSGRWSSHLEVYQSSKVEE
jgi:hypothetical protein